MQILRDVVQHGQLHFDVKLGVRRPLASICPGLSHWPDQPVADKSDAAQYEFFLTSNNRSYRLLGTSLTSLAHSPCLEPVPPPPRVWPFEYTGIGAIIDRDQSRFALFHSEDRNPTYPKLPGNVPGYQASIGIAEWDAGASRFVHPQLLLERPPHVNPGTYPGYRDDFYAAQGVGDPSAVVQDGFAYAFFTFNSRKFQFDQQDPHHSLGTQIAMARAPLAGLTQQGQWHYWDFALHFGGNPGNPHPVIDGYAKFGPSVDCIHPFVFPGLGETFCVFSVNDFSELPQPGAREERASRSGFYLAVCDQPATLSSWNWSRASQVVTGITIPFTGSENFVHPSIVQISVAGDTLSGWLVYGYSSCYSDQAPHLLWGQEIEIIRH